VREKRRKGGLVGRKGGEKGEIKTIRQVQLGGRKKKGGKGEKGGKSSFLSI